ncbi:tRNA1(Val) (adenine(37)-N6)-methyltransferase [Christiangramia sabulilitoris]|uniref:tRNA1(Val) (adenine(37)-N6)-methyltransferase n=1 Tax=Christiangramia sabulilitoris TaxID=2583991 RepID=A0A550I023_9FLAO|nr:methyltransferase [Christiangramia sabulilitoris]TRO64295.1 methyltransferase [Christiangramia sabulilitoris]
MSQKPFKFKQFSIDQDRCAMKIGTDGVLLGAWTSLQHQPDSILDIGTGTGLIALMLAQRSEAGLIDALEIEENAYEQAVDNFEKSDWGDRLFCYHAGFDEFVKEMQDEEKYDLIISNPPFYSEDYKSGNENRDQARFSDALPLEELIEGASLLLSDKGHFDLIIPFTEEQKSLKIAKDHKLFPVQITRVKGTESSLVKRSLISFTFENKDPEIDELILEISRHNYTEEFKALVEDFYLKL